MAATKKPRVSGYKLKIEGFRDADTKDTTAFQSAQDAVNQATEILMKAGFDLSTEDFYPDRRTA